MKPKHLAALALAFAMSSSNLLAQDDRATVTGTVTDPYPAAIPGASVEIRNKATGFHREVATNDAGVYRIPGLAIGIYEMTIRKDGFRAEQFNALNLVVGEVRTIDAQMQIAPNSQEVEVQAETAALAQSYATVGGVISSTQVSDIPINGRAWTSLMALVPGAIDSGGGTQKSIRFAGRGGDDNNYRFDGVDATGISNQAPNASFRLQISTEAIAEFKVDTVLFGAETGGTAGGQVEVISRSGTNSFHGSAFEFIRNNVISSRGPFDPASLPPLRLNQFGASVGGAIVRDHTFFFVAYEGLQQRSSTTLIGNVPSATFRAQALAQSPALTPIINAYPIGNRVLSADVSRYVSTGSISNGENSGLIRIDHRISDSTNFFARYNTDKALLQSPNGQLLDRTVTEAQPTNGSMSLSHVFSPAMFNLLRLGVNRIVAVNSTDSHFFDATKIVNSVSVSGFTKLAQVTHSVKAPTSYSLKNDFTWTRGAHTIQAGIEVKDVHYNYSQAAENALIWSTRASFIANKLDQLNLIGGVPTHGLDKWMAFGYVQDAWKAQPNLTVNVGLRYEFFNVFHEIYGRDRPFDLVSCGGFCPVGSQFTFPVTNNLEPRVSLAWSPKALKGKTVIRSGFGMYKGEGQLGDLNAPSDNYAQRSALSSFSFPNLSFPADSYYALAGDVALTPRGLARNRRDPSLLQWGLQTQTALAAGFILDTGYIGYHGYHQFARTSVNVLDPVTGLRPLPNFSNIDVKTATGNNHFHGWQTSLQRPFRSGASFALNYMWSHAINDGTSGGGEAIYIQNNSCRSCEVASSATDVRHTLSANAVYELPFGKGRRYLNNGRVVNVLLGGWELSGIFSARSGNPVNVLITRLASSVPDGTAHQENDTVTRPDYVGGVSVIPANQSISNWINPLAFAAPKDGTWGNAGRNLIRGPKFWQSDMSLKKSFPITERFVLDFRTEAFNVFNRAQFGDPSGDFSSPSFGQITTTVNNGSATGSGTPREFQFSMRLHF